MTLGEVVVEGEENPSPLKNGLWVLSPYDSRSQRIAVGGVELFAVVHAEHLSTLQRCPAPLMLLEELGCAVGCLVTLSLQLQGVRIRVTNKAVTSKKTKRGGLTRWCDL